MYFTSVYKSPAQVRAEKAALEATLMEKQSALEVIQEYLAKRETGVQVSDELSTLQDAIIKESDGLVTATKDNFESFDRQAKALRTIVSMQIDEINAELNK